MQSIVTPILNKPIGVNQPFYLALSWYCDNVGDCIFYLDKWKISFTVSNTTFYTWDGHLDNFRSIYYGDRDSPFNRRDKYIYVSSDSQRTWKEGYLDERLGKWYYEVDLVKDFGFTFVPDDNTSNYYNYEFGLIAHWNLGRGQWECRSMALSNELYTNRVYPFITRDTVKYIVNKRYTRFTNNEKEFDGCFYKSILKTNKGWALRLYRNFDWSFGDTYLYIIKYIPKQSNQSWIIDNIYYILSIKQLPSNNKDFKPSKREVYYVS